MIEIRNLSINYENNPAVDDVSLKFPSGRLTGLIGPNGAGKSSLLEACVGLITDYEGSIFFDGKDSAAHRFWVKARCGFAPEDTELLPYLKGREFLELIATIRRSEKVQDEIHFLIELFGLESKKEELVINYSHGMRQKLSIAAALLGSPDYLIFDEALNGLDSVSMLKLKRHLDDLAGQNKTIVISSHILPLVRDWCDPVVIMHEGKVVEVLTKDQIEKTEQRENKTFEAIYLELLERRAGN